MKRLAVLITNLLLILTVTSSASAWGRGGHTLVAEVATAGLGPNARARVSALLGGRTMSQVALWADDMRTWQRNREENGGRAVPPPPSLAGDPVARAFFEDRRNDNQPNWHFVDLPVGLERYQLGGVGTERDDVVQMIMRCIQVLRNSAPASENITPQQAIRLLIHYVGDLHQPLHSAAGYWAAGRGNAARLLPPADAGTGIADRGGNSLTFGPRQGQNLHTFWDGFMVTHASEGMTRAEYRSKLIDLVGGAASAPWRLPEDPMTLPQQWAGDSAHITGQIYQAIRTDRLMVVGRRIRGTIVIPAGFPDTFRQSVDTQLSRAGFRLAAVLNAIFP